VLVLTRRVDESLVIRDDIIVTVLAVDGDKVKIGIQAPADVTILRQELCDAVRQQNLAAARLAAGSATQSLDIVRQALQPGNTPATTKPPTEG
jgi:carbon storage regulator